MRYTFMGLILWLMAGVMTVSAASLEVEGLGKFPFRQNMEVTAAGGAAESQESRFVIFREGYGALPLWTDSHLFKAGKGYYLVTVVGSHMARNKLGKYVLYGIDGLERESL